MTPKRAPEAPKSVDPRSNVFSDPHGWIGFTLSPYPLSLLRPSPAISPKTRKNTHTHTQITEICVSHVLLLVASATWEVILGISSCFYVFSLTLAQNLERGTL